MNEGVQGAGYQNVILRIEASNSAGMRKDMKQFKFHIKDEDIVGNSDEKIVLGKGKDRARQGLCQEGV